MTVLNRHKRPTTAKSKPATGTADPAYRELVRHVRDLIDHGTLRPGDRVPSIRQLRQQSKRSISTVLHAYQILEGMGLIESRPQSGYYVRARPSSDGARVPTSTPPTKPQSIEVLGRITQINRAMCDPALVPLGGAHPGREMLPVAQLNKLERTLARITKRGNSVYERPAGAIELRQAIARCAMSAGCTLSPDDVIVTCGAQEALILCLRAVAKPGHVVAVESPSYFGFFQALESLGIKALEIPTHPSTGIDLDALEATLKRRKPAALLVCPNAQNPLGFVMSDANKRRLVDLITTHEVPMIEDDVYGDLAYAPHRPITCHSLDTAGLVMLISSFSKSLAPGMRIGWCAPGQRWRDRVEQLKFCTTIASPSLSQQVVAAFLDGGGYARQIRRVSRIYEQQTRAAGAAILDAFPDGTSVTTPAGGFVVWVQLPDAVEADRLYDNALRAGISIAPGTIFSPCARYRHHIRMSVGATWDARMSHGVKQVGTLARQLAVRG